MTYEKEKPDNYKEHHYLGCFCIVFLFMYSFFSKATHHKGLYQHELVFLRTEYHLFSHSFYSFGKNKYYSVKKSNIRGFPSDLNFTFDKLLTGNP